jgi:CrcB protein
MPSDEELYEIPSPRRINRPGSEDFETHRNDDIAETAVPADPPPTPVPEPPGLNFAVAYISIAVWAIIGALTRYGLEELFDPVLHTVAPSQSKGTVSALFRDIPANALGSFIMGLLCGAEKQLAPHRTWLFVGATSGFCGSCTTFSSWMAASGYTMWGPPTVTIQTVLQGAMSLFLGFAVAWSSLACGWRLTETILSSKCIADHERMLCDRAPNPRSVLSVGLALWAALEVGCGVGYVFATDPNVRMLMIAVVWAPVGAWIRYLLSQYNPRFPTFPVFTLLVNAVATAITCICIILLWSDAATVAIVTDATARILLQAVQLSFCGNLSTVSTLVKEVRLLDRQGMRPAAVYSFVTLLVGQLICALIFPPFYAAKRRY